MTQRPQSPRAGKRRTRPWRLPARRIVRLRASDPDAARHILAESGSLTPDVALEHLNALAQAAPGARLPSLVEFALASCDVDRALAWCTDALGDVGYRTAWIASGTDRGAPLRALLATVSLSRFLAERVRSDPGLLDVFSQSPRRFGTETLRREALERLANGPVATARRRLHAWWEERLLALAKFDLADEVSPRDPFAQTARLADVTLRVAFDHVREILRAAGLAPPEGDRFTVLALGKLGGAELNFSSDVDLVFLVESASNSYNSAPHERLARRLVRFLGTADGPRFYRVDLRLRPEGSTGPLTPTRQSALRYYRERGRPWERQMLLKARAVAGDLALGRSFVRDVRPFLIGASLDIASIDQLKGLREQMERRVKEDDRLEIKNGPGGIRDIEYVVQFLQLLHAREHPEILRSNTLQGLQELLRARAITASDHQALQDSYIFLRRVENRLQMVFDLPTHHVPDDRSARRRLARSLGFGVDEGAVERFEQELTARRSAARTVYSARLGSRFATGDETHRAVQDALLRDDQQDDPGDELRSLGFREPARAMAILGSLAEPGSRFLPRRPETRALLADFTPRLLARLARSPDPDLALHHLGRIASRHAARGAFLRTLADQPSFLDVLVDLGSHSTTLSELLVRDPDVLDAFVDALLVETRGARWRRRRVSLERLEQSGDGVRMLGEFKALELLRVGVRDIQGRSTLPATLFSLAHVAYHTVRRLLEWCAVQLGQRDLDGFVILGVGKVGGLEISYGSDVDVLFVADERVWDLQDATRLAQRVMQEAGRDTPLGRLYRIDARLRPEGESGPLVASWSAFEAYYRSPRAALFERQALLKASRLAGDRALADRALALLRDEVIGSAGVDPRADLGAMRSKLEQGNRSDLKRGVGGLLDAEFLVQCLQLLHGRDDPRILRSNLLRALHHLVRGGWFAADDARDLEQDYLFLRRVESRGQLMGRSGHQLPVEDAVLDHLGRCCGFGVGEDGRSPGPSLRQEVDSARHRLRQIYRAVVDADAPTT